MKHAILLVNLGTPDSPSTKDVRKYLFEFLNDPRVIDIPWLTRKLLVNLIIVPFRAPKSAKIYKQLWTDKGSPLLYYSESLRDKLQKELPQNYQVELAMRYQNPSIEEALLKIKKQNPDKITVIPLFPQYASASTGSVMEKVLSIIKNWYVIPELHLVSQFYQDPAFIDLFVENGKKYQPETYEHVLFSFHGLPERQVDKVYEEGLCAEKDCEHQITDENKFCYKAASYETARQIAKKLNIPENKYTICFQSRLGRDPWIKPYSDFVVRDKAKEGIKKMLVFSPAFVADCLETTIEIGHEYAEIFKEHGGHELQLVASLNDDDHFVAYIKNKVLKMNGETW